METHWRICRITSRQLSPLDSPSCVHYNIIIGDWMIALFAFIQISVHIASDGIARATRRSEIARRRYCSCEVERWPRKQRRVCESKFMTSQSDFPNANVQAVRSFFYYDLNDWEKEEEANAFGWNRFKEIDPDGDIWMGVEWTFKRLSIVFKVLLSWLSEHWQLLINSKDFCFYGTSFSSRVSSYTLPNEHLEDLTSWCYIRKLLISLIKVER